MGLTFFIEDGVEEDNILQYNLAIMTKKSSSLLNVDAIPSSFWITNANNIWRHNHVAGSTHFGYWFNAPTQQIQLDQVLLMTFAVARDPWENSGTTRFIQVVNMASGFSSN